MGQGEPLSPTERDELILSHLKYVRAIARKISRQMPPTVLVEDLVSAGFVGLVSSANGFRKNGLDFRFFARKRIRGAMLDMLRSLDWISRTARKNGTGPTAKFKNFTDLSMQQERHQLVTEHGSAESESSWLEDERAEHFQDAVATAEMKRWVMDHLPGRMAKIIDLYHGPDAMTFEEIAGILNLTEGRVCWLYHEALKRIRKLVKKQ